MSKLIQKAGFLNPKRAGRYMNYIATRDGVELLDENADSIYMRYIATRPRAEKHGEHGLFGAEDAVDLEKTLGELKAHEGNVWTIIYSLRREDAAHAFGVTTKPVSLQNLLEIRRILCLTCGSLLLGGKSRVIAGTGNARDLT